ncbi:unnamed protein product [Amoebophrya sp. A120]|nr:unnamed protein product [Amoebophrya sp. A120]|eukprot:GSA120T00015576001.1
MWNRWLPSSCNCGRAGRERGTSTEESDREWEEFQRETDKGLEDEEAEAARAKAARAEAARAEAAAARDRVVAVEDAKNQLNQLAVTPRYNPGSKSLPRNPPNNRQASRMKPDNPSGETWVSSDEQSAYRVNHEDNAFRGRLPRP